MWVGTVRWRPRGARLERVVGMVLAGSKATVDEMDFAASSELS